jgi:hypothetical protein
MHAPSAILLTATHRAFFARPAEAAAASADAPPVQSCFSFTVAQRECRARVDV